MPALSSCGTRWATGTLPAGRLQHELATSPQLLPGPSAIHCLCSHPHCPSTTTPPPHPHPQQELLVSPQLLASHAIPVVRVVHNPREFVVVFPGAYHRWVGGWAGGTSE